MKLYLVTGEVTTGKRWQEKALQFCGTQRERNAAIRSYKNHPGIYRNVSSEEIDVPTNKNGLLIWLNSYTLDELRSPTLD